MFFRFHYKNGVNDEQSSLMATCTLTYIRRVSLTLNFLNSDFMKFSHYVEGFLHLQYNLGSTTSEFS